MAMSHKDLPDECWKIIFNKLHQQHHSHLESSSLSCKRFLSITNTLRTSLKIFTHTALIPLSALFTRFPNLNSIYLRFFRSGDLNRLIADIATSDLNLETLDFTGTDGLPLESWRLLGSRMKNIKVLICPNLRTLRDIELVVIADSMPCLDDLDISHPSNYFGSVPELQGRSLGEVGLTDSGIEVVSSKLKGLRIINVSGNEFLTDKSLIALSTNCVYLTDIVVLNCSLVTSDGIEFVMRNSTNLSLVSVDGIGFGSLDDCSIRCARNISTLEIHDSVVPDGYLHLLAKAGIPLKSFTLSHCETLTFSGISSVLSKYSSLKSLSLDGIDVLTDEKMSDLSQYLPALDTICLDFCVNLTELTFFKLAKNCSLLEYISMIGTNLGGGGDEATDIVKNPRIKSLNLEDNSNLSDECLAKLASVCPSLEVLLVSSCKGITEKGIADFLKSCSKVRSLLIDECEGIKNIGNGFELSKLDFLGATRSGIDDDGLVVIGNRCHGLLHLNLEGCLGVTTVGLKEILTNCEKLRKINLTGCLNVRTETVDWMVFSRPSLREIILSYTSLPSESQRKLFLLHGCLVSTRRL
ncbi:uncharacterized protein LOC131329559 [Rhododendron vialii]|uniref:uncharacterized protein LOC131329559 n=1 Tax=Rhododendron vialii TaxID=182163 RepID=UPI00265DB972|nr:uncharacterized protein LOC131329559 [Rhododendron vialii]XP_058218725.1 uncharacterized protein LOC131329559 [Rhododendron vialii]XP_058218726.1 uncharacterized protein LOC131329559 [Rhododendron vialii]XP_058218727.1 uncharacterized protein LOC131329559 [Rhododendron vialii]XP_058218728.1 uncharacterized protein LOC131329559 [Rhododendron vialii]XP_058218730.1 uncharacterized protein LOC131329559 [Rhododendron vialii]XP_058218731.1 uncharacterized protein LOC131329559 [Rhododendron viali